MWKPRFPAASAVVLALLLVACGEKAPPPPPSGPAMPVLPVSPLLSAPRNQVLKLGPKPDGPERVKFAIHLLLTGDQKEVVWAGDQLGRIGTPAIQPLLSAMTARLTTNSEFVRNALQVFGKKLPAPAGIAAFARVTASGDLSLAREAAVALGNTGSPAAVAPLVKLAESRDTYTADTTMKQLGRLPAGPVAKALRPCFPGKLNSSALAAAVTRIAEGIDPKQAVAFLTGLLGSSDIGVSVTAAIDLLRRGDPAGRKELHARIRSGLPLVTELTALASLSKEHDPFALERLIRLSKGPAQAGPVSVAASLARYDSQRARAALRGLVGSARIDLKAEALYWLVKTGGRKQREELLRRLGSPDRQQRLLAALVIARMNDTGLAKAAAAAADKEKDENVRIKLLDALAIQKRPEGIPAAIRALADETHGDPGKADLAVSAASLLSAMPELPRATLKRLEEMAKKGIPSVRMMAARVLARLGTDEAAKSAIASLFSSEFPQVRMDAAWSWVEFVLATPEPLLDMASRERNRGRAAALVIYAKMIRCRVLPGK